MGIIKPHRFRHSTYIKIQRIARVQIHELYFFCRASFLSVIKVVLLYCLDLIHLPPIFWVKRFQMQRLFFNLIDIEDRKKVCNLQMIFKRKWPVVCHFPM